MPCESETMTSYATNGGSRALLLASSSPYRKALLQRLNLEFQQHAPDVDETRLPEESAADLVRRLARQKAAALTNLYPRHLIIGGDQVAELDQQIIGKPHTVEAACGQLRAASGKELIFYTGVCVIDSQSNSAKSDVVSCRVRFKDLTAQQIERYIATESPLDCAGSFKNESLGIALFDAVETDDPTTLTGLPLICLVRLLLEHGLDVLTCNANPAT